MKTCCPAAEHREVEVTLAHHATTNTLFTEPPSNRYDTNCWYSEGAGLQAAMLSDCCSHTAAATVQPTAVNTGCSPRHRGSAPRSASVWQPRVFKRTSPRPHRAESHYLTGSGFSFRAPCHVSSSCPRVRVFFCTLGGRGARATLKRSTAPQRQGMLTAHWRIFVFFFSVYTFQVIWSSCDFISTEPESTDRRVHSINAAARLL